MTVLLSLAIDLSRPCRYLHVHVHVHVCVHYTCTVPMKVEGSKNAAVI